ncbi:unnamed protein product [Calicophoron daubneyi]|uniref:Major facilitator superfamily (MFS) profile domain-containing protein n=1 Tax=Calicophoron daubneyi TaxID=300641 RepID=A0AAV2T2G9_CALDB
MRRRVSVPDDEKQENKTCMSKPTVYHAAVIIFLEFFAFGLLTNPMISVLDETFPKQTFLMNGVIQGVKGLLSFMSAPLLGALSDALGRKPFLLLTVTFTCSPIPLMKISHWWYFTMISISGIFAVTFSVVLAYVADITTEEERSWGYGLVSATFAASLVSSPAIGAYIGRFFSEDVVVALATAIAFLDIFFIMSCVPESLPDKVRTTHLCSATGRGSGSSGKISWDKIDPFAALRKLTNDYLVLIVCITTFFSYLPEAGQYSCFVVYLRLILGFSEESVAFYIAYLGILSCISQTFFLGLLNRYIGYKRTIVVGLICEAAQLFLFGFATEHALLWIAGGVAAMGSLTYPALSAFVSNHSAADQQGVAQGLIAGIRGLCGGLGPALFGLIFYIFRVDLNDQSTDQSPGSGGRSATILPGSSEHLKQLQAQFLPGPPFAFGAVLVLLAILAAWFIPEPPQLPTSATGPGCPSQDSDGTAVEAFDGSRLRRSSPIRDYDQFTSQEQVNEQEYNDNSFLLNQKTRLKHNSGKVHFGNREVGLWDRIMSGLSNRRRALPIRRPTRILRPSGVSFTRSHLVDPIRRLIVGLSTGGRTIDGAEIAELPGHSSGLDANSFSSGNDGRNKVYSGISLSETEADDLSNYRSHHLNNFLTFSPESEVVTAHRFDLSHNGRGGFPSSHDNEERQGLLDSLDDHPVDKPQMSLIGKGDEILRLGIPS